MNISLDIFLGLFLKLNGFVSRSIEIKGSQVHYLEKKPKNPRGAIVLLHGIGAFSGHYWKVAGPLYQAGFAVYIPDLPSHGKSVDPIEEGSSEPFYEIFVEWLSKVVPSKLILVGNSLGGAVGLRYVAENPGRVTSLILISPAGGFVSEAEWVAFKKSLEFESVEDSRRFVPKIFHQPPFYIPFTYQSFFQTMRSKGIRNLVKNTAFEQIRFQNKERTKVDEKEVWPPTLFIWGKSEKLFPPHHLDEFKKVLPEGVVFEEPENIGHCPQLDNPGWLTQRILQFAHSGVEEFHPVIFFDGVCNMCNWTVDFIMKRDPGLFYFAPLQGRTVKERFGVEWGKEAVQSIILWDEQGLSFKSDAAIRIVSRLGGAWRLASVLRFIPSGLRNRVYEWVANYRYRWFGKRESCRLPTFEEKKRFLD